eukprot:380045-Prymnesium_polylepis.1
MRVCAARSEWPRALRAGCIPPEPQGRHKLARAGMADARVPPNPWHGGEESASQAVSTPAPRRSHRR